MKTIITASIPIELANKLKGKTKGTRSRTVTRALQHYLTDEENFSIADIDTRKLATVLLNRLHEKNNYEYVPLTLLLRDIVVESNN